MTLIEMDFTYSSSTSYSGGYAVVWHWTIAHCNCTKMWIWPRSNTVNTLYTELYQRRTAKDDLC